MTTRTSLVAAAILIVAGWMCWSLADVETEAAPVTLAETPTGSVAETPEPASNRVRDEVVQRVDVAAAEPAVVRSKSDDKFDPSPVLVAPWLARILVVDDDQRPVADAKVTIWLAKKRESQKRKSRIGRKTGYVYAGRELEPIHELRTDASGRLQVTLTHECLFAGASKVGYERSAELSMWSARAPETETTLWLEAPVVLRGVARGPDGLPAANAVVTGRSTGLSALRRGVAPSPESVLCDGNGRFELIVRKRAWYSVAAELGGLTSLTERVTIMSANPPDITLVFPGAISISGTVFDSSGQSVAGAAVSAWREIDLSAGAGEGAEAGEHVRATADSAGRFSMAVRAHARYQLVARAAGHANSDLVWAETSSLHSHPDVRIGLLDFTTIRGRVVRDDGSAFAEVKVSAEADTGLGSPPPEVPGSIDMFARVEHVTTDSEGMFELRVHPGTTWTVAAVPFSDNDRLRIERSDVAPNTKDLVLRCREIDLAGCVVHGVVRRIDGQAVGDYEVSIVEYGTDRTISLGRAVAQTHGDRFTLPPLPLGKKFAIRVTPNGGGGPADLVAQPVAPAQSDPFVTDRASISLEFVLEPWGELPVRVLTSAGQPAQKLRVQASSRTLLGLHQPGQPIDVEGRALLHYRAPGPYRLQVWNDSSQMVWEQALTVKPGPNPEVVVRLPATPPASNPTTRR